MSVPATYIVHRDSQDGPDDICAYVNSVHTLINEAAEGREQAYFGRDLGAPLRVWSAAEKETQFDPAIALAAISTPEIAINPVALAQKINECVTAHPLIEVRCGRTVVGGKEQRHGMEVHSEGQGGSTRDCFDHVVNALWDGRLGLNEKLGFPVGRPCMHRLKYGVSFRLPAGATPPPSATFVLGPFGEVVTYGDGLIYLTWYPECLQGISTDVTPPEWDTYPAEPLRSRILTGTFRALSAIVPSLRDLDPENLPEASSKAERSWHGAKQTFTTPQANYINGSRSASLPKEAFTPSIPESPPWRRTSRKFAPSGLVPPANASRETQAVDAAHHRGSASL